MGLQVNMLLEHLQHSKLNTSLCALKHAVIAHTAHTLTLCFTEMSPYYITAVAAVQMTSVMVLGGETCIKKRYCFHAFL